MSSSLFLRGVGIEDNFVTLSIKNCTEDESLGDNESVVDKN